MSISPERFCLGGLMKEIDKEYNPEEINSKDETSYQSSSDQRFSSNDSIFSSNFPTLIFYPSLALINKNNEQSNIYTKKNILTSFGNQKSTKILQKSLLDASHDTIDNIIKELSGMFRTIIKHRNGNYFCTDLLKVCDKEQRIRILNEISNYLSEDCTDEFANHLIQNLIDLSSSEEEYNLILSSFNDYNKILMASLSQNGSFVIQKLIVHIPEKIRKDFNLIIVKLFCILSRDMYGVCTAKKFIYYTKDELILKEILNSLIINFINISSNQYGNYLIQYLLEKWWKTKEGVYLKKLIISKFQVLMKNHYSAYICDLFIKLCNNEEKKALFSFFNNCKDVKKNIKKKIKLSQKNDKEEESKNQEE